MQQNQDKETIYQKQEKIIKIKQPNACKKAQKDQNFHILGIRVAKQLKRAGHEHIERPKRKRKLWKKRKTLGFVKDKTRMILACCPLVATKMLTPSNSFRPICLEFQV